MMRARIVVTLKPSVLDPQGKAIEGALRSLGLDGFANVRQGKVFDVELDGVKGEAAQGLLMQACEKLLANTIVENYAIEHD
jgi:phosphoribosylformylglycinamidine synthase